MDNWAQAQYCYLTTAGRRSGQPHTVEIWFATPEGSATLYILAGSGEKADWVKNLRQNPRVQVRFDSAVSAIVEGHGRIVTQPEEDMLARRLVVSKYYGRSEVQSSGWEATSLPVAIDLQQ